MCCSTITNQLSVIEIRGKIGSHRDVLGLFLRAKPGSELRVALHDQGLAVGTGGLLPPGDLLQGSFKACGRAQSRANRVPEHIAA